MIVRWRPLSCPSQQALQLVVVLTIVLCVCLNVQLENAKRIASGDLFPTSWVEFDERAKELEQRTNKQQ